MADTSLPGSAAKHRKEAQAEEHEIAKDARAGGAPAFEFNANTSPADKAAVAKQVRVHRDWLSTSSLLFAQPKEKKSAQMSRELTL
jgi:hypothetical protein